MPGLDGDQEPDLGPILDPALIPEPFTESTFVTPETTQEPAGSPEPTVTLEQTVFLQVIL